MRPSDSVRGMRCYVCGDSLAYQQRIRDESLNILVHSNGVCDRYVEEIRKETWSAFPKKTPTKTFLLGRIGVYHDLPVFEAQSRLRALLRLPQVEA